jgi:molecular chaperone GrpE
MPEDTAEVSTESDEALRAENAAVRDKLLRALADGENIRRRAERSVEDARQFAIADFARELLLVADNLRRTLEAAERNEPVSAPDEALIQGVAATERVLLHIFSRFGIRKLEALGKPFDPTMHEAVMQVDDPTAPPGSVVQVLEDGYTIHGRLLRPAKVVVTRTAQDPSRPPQTGGSDGGAGQGETG